MTRNRGSFVVAIVLVCMLGMLTLAKVETRAADAAPAIPAESVAPATQALPGPVLPGFIHIAGLPRGVGGPLTLYTAVAGCRRGSCTGCGYGALDCIPIKELGTCPDPVGCFQKIEIVTISYDPVPIPDAGTDAGTDGGGTASAPAVAAGTPEPIVIDPTGSSIQVGGAGLLIASGTFAKQRDTSIPTIKASRRVETIRATKDGWTLVFAPRWQLEGGRWRDIKPHAHVDPPVAENLLYESRRTTRVRDPYCLIV